MCLVFIFSLTTIKKCNTTILAAARFATCSASEHTEGRGGGGGLPDGSLDLQTTGGFEPPMLMMAVYGVNN